MLKLASRNTLLCSFRVDDNLVWSLLTNHTAKKVGNRSHQHPARQHPDGQPRVGSAQATPTSRSSPSNPTISRKPATATPTVAKSVLNESKQIERAAMLLIQMGARMQVLESKPLCRTSA